MTRLEFWRRTRGLSQDALAAMLGRGFTASVVSMMEAGRLAPTDKQRARFRETFGATADSLLELMPVEDFLTERTVEVGR